MNIKVKVEKKASIVKHLNEFLQTNKKGMGLLLTNKYILPESCKSSHINRLIKNKKVSLKKKAEIFSNNRLLNQWTYLVNPSYNLSRERLKYNIDINNHIINYDPTGKTLGCGCSFCGQAHRVNKSKEKLKENKLAINFMNVLMHRKVNNKKIENNVINMISSLKSKTHINYLTNCMHRNIQDLATLKNKYSILNKKLEYDLENEEKTLSLMSELLRIPIGIHKPKSIFDLYKTNKAKSKLLELENLKELDTILLIKLAKDLNLFYQKDKKIKKLYKLKPKLIKRLEELKIELDKENTESLLDEIFCEE